LNGLMIAVMSFMKVLFSLRKIVLPMGGATKATVMPCGIHAALGAGAADVPETRPNG